MRLRSPGGAGTRPRPADVAAAEVVEFDHFTSSWQEFTTLLRSGGVFYGGLIAAVLVCVYQLRKHHLPLWPSADLFAPGIALGYMVGRLGCLLAGCCYGRPTDVGVGDHVHRPGGKSERRYAAQCAAAPNPAVPSQPPASPSSPCSCCWSAAARRRRGPGPPRWGAHGFAGRTFWLFVLLYSISRFVIEFYRGDDRGMPLAWLSTSQLISVVLAPVAIAMLWYLSRPAQPPAAETPVRPRKPRFA